MFRQEVGGTMQPHTRVQVKEKWNNKASSRISFLESTIPLFLTFYRPPALFRSVRHSEQLSDCDLNGNTVRMPRISVKYCIISTLIVHLYRLGDIPPEWRVLAGSLCYDTLVGGGRAYAWIALLTHRHSLRLHQNPRSGLSNAWLQLYDRESILLAQSARPQKFAVSWSPAFFVRFVSNSPFFFFWPWLAISWLDQVLKIWR